jgi:hypothetical protein
MGKNAFGAVALAIMFALVARSDARTRFASGTYSLRRFAWRKIDEGE